MNSWTSPVDIRPDHLAIVQEILHVHLPAGFKVWVFGSRANWTTKDSSDLDLAVEGAAKLDHKAMVGLEVAFEESGLPYTVDVVDLKAVSSNFRRIVEDQRIPLPPAAPRKVSSEWRKVTLGELTENFDAIRVPVKESDRKPGPYPYYGASGVVDRVDGFLFDGQYLLIAEDGENLRTRATPIAFLADGRFWVNNHAHIVRGNHHADTRFLNYALSNLDISGYLTGSTMPKLTQRNMNQILLTVPPLPEQRRIAHILGTLDDKIELNRGMNQTLEAMARAIFQDWFVDFGPTRAKMEGQEPYLPPELWDLFPDELVDSELGDIPKGWEVTPLSECIMIDKGLSYKGAGLSPTGMPMHNLNSVHEGGGYKDYGIKFYNGDFRNRHITRPGDVLVTNTEQGHDRLLIGFAAIVPSRFGKEGIFSHHIYRVQPRNYTGLTSDFICHLLNTKSMHETISGYATGTTVNMLPTDALVIPEIIVPSRSVVEIFSGFSKDARARQEKFIEECQQLTELRDNLLPRLVSGEVPVELVDSPSEL